MDGSSREISGIDIINEISKVLDNPGIRKIIIYLTEHQTDAILDTDLAKKINVTTSEVNKAMVPLLKRQIVRCSTGKNKYISWNQDSKEGLVLLNLFQPLKKVDDFFDSLARYCDLFLAKKLGEELSFRDYLKEKRNFEERKLRLDGAQKAINEEKLRLQKEKQGLKRQEHKYRKLKTDFEDESKINQKQEELPIKRIPYRRRMGLAKLKSLFKIESREAATIEDNALRSKVIKPEVMSMPNIGSPVALQIPGLQECGVCLGDIGAGETFIKCSCELITHVGCINNEQNCPQCGRELDLELILPKNYEMKTAVKKPTIYEEKKREIEELIPPSTSYFAHVPQITKEDRIKNFVSKFYDNHKMGRSTQTKNVSDIDIFISIQATEKMLEHCYEHGREKEVMGLILGETYQYEDKLFSIAKDVATSDLEATEINVRFDSFDKLFEELDQLEYDYQIIGWYHSHPNYSSYMSITDINTQKRMFKQPYQRAIVIDPILFDMKAFALDENTKDNIKESGYAIIDFKD